MIVTTDIITATRGVLGEHERRTALMADLLRVLTLALAAEGQDQLDLICHAADLEWRTFKTRSVGKLIPGWMNSADQILAAFRGRERAAR